MKNMRYKNFKKVHEDAHSATMLHPEGHTIKIAKGALSDHIKKQLSSLPFAEKEEMQHLADGGSVKDGYISAASGYEQGTKKADMILRGDKRQMGPTEDQERAHKQVWKGSDRSHSLALPAGMADGGEVEEPDAQDAADFYGTSVGPGPVEEPAQEMAAPQAEPQNPVLEAPPVPANLPPMPNPVAEGVQQMQQGVQQGAQADAALGRREAAVAHDNTAKLQALDSMHQQNMSRVQGEIDNVINEVRQQKIDPNHFWNNRSTPAKFSTAIGLILGGMGAGINGGENPALRFLNQQIDRDVESQKENMSNKVNALRGLQQQFGNINDAANVYKAMQAGVFASQMMEEAAKSKDPAAMARAKLASGEILAKYGPVVQQTALKQTVLQGMQKGIISPAQAVPHVVPENRQKEALEEIKHSENQARGVKDLQNTMAEVAKLQSYSNRAMNPLQSKSQIDALNTKIAGHVKEIFGKTSDTELEILKDNQIKVTDNPETIAKKTKIITDLASKELSHPTLDAYGIKLPKQTSFNKR